MTAISRQILSLALFVVLGLAGTAAAETYSYDVVGRLTQVAFNDGSSIGYEYDNAGNITKISRTPGALPPDGQIDTPDEDVTIEIGESIDFSSTVADPDGALPLVIRWNFDSAAPDSDEEDPGLIAFDTAGTYNVELNVTDATGLSDPTPARRVVTVNSAPALPPEGIIDRPSGNVTIESGQTVEFASTVSDPDGALPLTIRWDFDGASADSNVEDPGAIEFASEGTYNVTLNVTDADGLADPTPATRIVTVQAAAGGGGNGGGSGNGGSSGAGSIGPLGLLVALVLVLGRVRGWKSLPRAGSFSGLGVLLVALALPVSGNTQSQWIQLDTGFDVNLNDVWGTSADNVFVVGAAGTILRFDGEIWTEMESGTTSELNAVHGYGPDEVYAVGADRTFLRFDGDSWAPFAGPAEETNAFVDVWTAGAGERLWVLGLRRAWYRDGAAWAVQGFRDNLNVSLTPNGAMQGLGGTASATIVASRPQGGTDQVDGGIFANFFHIGRHDTRAVFAASDSDIFAVGRNSYRFQGDNVRNRGSWQPISVMGEAYDVWGTSASNVYAVGTGFVSTNSVIAHYDGNETNSWTQEFELPLRQLNAVWGASESDIWVVGDAGVIMQYAESEPPQTAANFPNSGWAGDFVNGHTGELVLEQVDFAFNACLPFEFSRYYASGLTPGGQVGGSLGPNWSHNYEWHIQNDADSVTIITWRGRILEFERSGEAWVNADPLDEGYKLLDGTSASQVVLFDTESERMYVFDTDRARLETVEDRFGNKVRIDYSIVTGKPQFITDGVSLSIQLTYGLEELLSIRTGVEGAYRTVEFGYTDGQLTSVTDPENGRTEFLYESPASDRYITAVRMPEGNVPYTWTYGADNRVSKQIDTFANESTIAYQSGTSPTSMQGPDGSDVRLSHDENGQLVSATNGEGESVSMAYDGVGRVTNISTPTGVVTTLEYHPTTGVLSRYAKSGAGDTVFSSAAVATVLGQDVYDVTRVEQAGVNPMTIEHNAAGRRTAIVDQKQKRWTYGYDSTGNLVSAGLPSGVGFTMERDARCNVRSATDPAGNVTRYTYDRYNRLFAVEHPDSTRRVTQYDDAGRLVAMINERGKTITRTFDGNGNVVKVSIPTMPDVTYVHDAMDRIKEVHSPKNAVTKFEYDAVGRLQSIDGPLQELTKFGYDKADRMTSVQSGTRTPWSMKFSEAGLPDSFTAPGMLAVDLDSTERQPGRLDIIADDATGVVKIYDELGRFAGFDDTAGNEVLRVDYDERGSITEFRSHGGAISTGVAYNDLGRPTMFRDANGNEWVRGYDPAGRLTRVEDPLGRFSKFDYDNRSRINTVIFPGGLGSLTILRNESGAHAERDYTDGTFFIYGYDDLGRLTSANGVEIAYDDNGKQDNSNGIVIGHDAEDRVETLELAPGKAITYRYDARGKLEHIDDWNGRAISFANGDTEQLDGITRANGVNTVLDYDTAGRLDYIEVPGISLIDLKFDGKGRVSQATRNVPKPAGFVDAGVEAYSFDAASQTTQFSHDALGRRISDDRRSYRWNLASRMLDYVEDGTTVAFDYDALGSRIYRSDTEGTREYVWNYALGLPSVSVERRDGADRRYYVHTPAGDLLYSIESNGERRFYHFDERGNTLYITGETGNVLASYAYSPYGEVLAEQGSIDNAFTFMGKRGVMREGDTDLYYARARYYDAKTGRFLSRDAEKSYSPKRGNPYQYARGNPLMFSDPTGLSEEEKVGWFTSLQRKAKSWWNDEEDLVNAGFDVESVVSEIRSPWEALSGTVYKHFDKVIRPVSERLEEVMGLRQRLSDRNKLSVFHNNHFVDQLSRLNETITRAQALRSKVMKALGGLEKTVGLLGNAATVFSEDSGQWTTTAYGGLAGKLSVGGGDALLSSSPFYAMFSGASSLFDMALEPVLERHYGMKDLNSAAHEVPLGPFRWLVAAGEDLLTKPKSNRESAMYKLADKMRRPENNLGASAFGWYQLGESIDESLGISDGIAKYILGVDEE